MVNTDGDNTLPLFVALPDELEEKILFRKLVDLFYEKDLDWRDIAEAIDDCSSDGDCIQVLVSWIDSQSYDDDWKNEVPAYVFCKGSL